MFSNAQKEAIMHMDGPALILAGPGSGKTTVITHRVRYLIEQGKILGNHILVITFTRAAAAEMRDRFSSLMDGNLHGVTFGTFHSVFFRILRYAYHYDASNILTEQEQSAIIKELIDRLAIDVPDEQEFIFAILGEISSIKNNHISLDHYYSKSCSEKTFRQLYTAYEKKLSSLRKVDFDDILLMTYELLKSRSDILKAWRQKFRYILIDEFQDINYIQYQIVRLLAAPSNHLFIVGDDDQSIYRFRGARPEIMLGFEKDYPNAKKLLLDINFRSDACIVSSSLRLISHNQTRFQKAIQPHYPAKNPVALYSCQSLEEQNKKITNHILSLYRQGTAYHDMAILFRTNLSGRFLTEALMKASIPFALKDYLPNLHEHWIALDLRAYLAIANGNCSRSLWLRIINRPNRYISRDAFLPFTNITLEQLRTYYKEKSWMLERLDVLEYHLHMLSGMTPYAGIHYIRKVINYEEYLNTYITQRHSNRQELFDVLDSVHESTHGCKSLKAWEEQIDSYTEELKRQSRNRQNPSSTNKTDSKTDAVCLSTLHAAKGLEYPIVFLPDVNEDNIPHSRACLDMDLEEERRLFYVGMTRAKKQLFLYCVRERLNHQKAPSRFLFEINSEKK